MSDARKLDLDALEAQRREGRGDALQVTWRGRDYLLPAELPMEAVAYLSAMADVQEVPDDADPAEAAKAMQKVSKALDGGLAVMFCTCPEPPEKKVHLAKSHEGDCQWPTFTRTRPSLDTRMALVNGVWEAYGITLGEALALTQPQPASGRPSEQTSNGTTGLTPATSGGGVKAPADRKRPAKKKAAAPKRAPGA